MTATRLLGRIDGVEVPAPGAWTIRHGHASVTVRRRAAVPCPGWSHVGPVAGLLAVGPTHLSLVVRPVAGADERRRVVLRADDVVPVDDVTWRARGDLDVCGARLAADVTVRYHGVYRSGDEARAWLVVSAATVHGRWRAASVSLTADVLATASPRTGQEAMPAAA